MPNQFLDQLGQQTATEAVNTGMGLMLGGLNDRRQLQQQGKLTQQQMAYQKQMTEWNNAQQLAMWKKTGPVGMMEELKIAGLNPGLIYGMSGAGGGTTGTPAPQVHGAEAPKGGREVQDMLGMGMQLQMLQAQKNLIQAQTEKTKGETANLPATGEQIKTQTLDLLQGIENKKAQETLTKVQTRILGLEETLKGASMQDTLDRIKWEAKSAEHTMGMLENEVYIQGKTMEDKIKTVHAELIAIGLRNALTKAQTELTKEGITTADWERRYTILGGYTNKLKETTLSSERNSLERQKLSEEINKDTGIDTNIINDIIDAVILKKILAPTEKTKYIIKDKNAIR